MPIVDFQTQFLSPRWFGAIPSSFRKWGRFWGQPASRFMHQVQPWTRFLPSPARTLVEEVGALGPVAHALFESTPEDLKASMFYNQIDHCVILSDGTRVTNSQLIALAQEFPQWIPGIRVPAHFQGKREAIHSELKTGFDSGAKILQLHPAADGISADSDFYSQQLEFLTSVEGIAIVQSGAPQSHLFYKKPELSEIQKLQVWFERYPRLRFVLSRMGFSDPASAIDVAEKFENVYLETSWQPTESIAEAVRRVGADKILFGSDWPILGNNQSIGISRVQDAVDSEMISKDDGKKILGDNALRLLGIQN